MVHSFPKSISMKIENMESKVLQKPEKQNPKNIRLNIPVCFCDSCVIDIFKGITMALRARGGRSPPTPYNLYYIFYKNIYYVLLHTCYSMCYTMYSRTLLEDFHPTKLLLSFLVLFSGETSNSYARSELRNCHLSRNE